MALPPRGLFSPNLDINNLIRQQQKAELSKMDRLKDPGRYYQKQFGDQVTNAVRGIGQALGGASPDSAAGMFASYIEQAPEFKAEAQRQKDRDEILAMLDTDGDGQITLEERKLAGDQLRLRGYTTLANQFDKSASAIEQLNFQKERAKIKDDFKTQELRLKEAELASINRFRLQKLAIQAKKSKTDYQKTAVKYKNAPQTKWENDTVTQLNRMLEQKLVTKDKLKKLGFDFGFGSNKIYKSRNAKGLKNLWTLEGKSVLTDTYLSLPEIIGNYSGGEITLPSYNSNISSTQPVINKTGNITASLKTNEDGKLQVKNLKNNKKKSGSPNTKQNNENKNKEKSSVTVPPQIIQPGNPMLALDQTQIELYRAAQDAEDEKRGHVYNPRTRMFTLK